MDEFDFDDYQRQVLEDARREAVENDFPQIRPARLIEFVSRSNGRGRKPRRPRAVSMLEYGRTVFQIVRGEIKARRGELRPDVIANEALAYLPPDERTTDRLIEEVKRRQLR